MQKNPIKCEKNLINWIFEQKYVSHRSKPQQWRSRLERLPRMPKVECSNPSRDRPKPIKQIVTALLLNAQQTTGVNVTVAVAY